MGDYVFLESWDYYYTARATPNGAQAQWVKSYLDQELVPGPFGGMRLKHGRAGGTEDIYCDLPNGNITTGEITIGFAFWVSNAISRNLMVLMQAGGTTAQFSIYQNSDGSVSIRNGNGGTVLGTSAAGLLTLNTRHYLEVSVDIDNAGSAVVDLGGVQILTVSGVDTMGAANVNVGRIMLPEPASSGTMWYDDLYVRDDLTRAGPSRVVYRPSIAAIAGGDFNLAATGAFILPVLTGDQATDTTSYITGGTVTDEQFFKMDDLGKLAGAAVRAVSLMCFARTNAGTATLDPVVKSNGDETTGASWSLDSTFRYRRRMFNLDPDIAAAWSRAKLAASEGGVRITGLAGGATSVQISQLGYQCLIPENDYNVAGGHRYWRVSPLSINGDVRPGSFAMQFLAPDGALLWPKVCSGAGGLWSGDNDYWRANDGRKDTTWISGSMALSTTYVADFGGPVIAKTFVLGAQPFAVRESIRTFTIDYSDDGISWTTLYTETTPQTAWGAAEVRIFALPNLPPPSAGRRRQALVL